MLISFFESFKHVGHLIPIAGLRIYLGVYYIYECYSRYNNDFVSANIIPSLIKDNLSEQLNIGGYQNFISGYILDHWKFVAYFVLICVLLIGISFIFGFMVKVFSLIAIFLSLHILMFGSSSDFLIHQILIGVNLTFFLIGAGRCIGIDYFFYKKTRGLFW